MRMEAAKHPCAPSGMAKLRTPTSPSADGEAEGETARPLRETSRRGLTNLHAALPLDPAAVLPGIDSEERKATSAQNPPTAATERRFGRRMDEPSSRENTWKSLRHT